MRNYAVLDVFTDRPLSGNQLAVVLDAAGLDDAAMQRIAREFNLSETVFVSPPANPVHTASLRIFTPFSELPFAGHPTIGAAVLLAGERFPEPAPAGVERDAVVILEEKVGPVRCGVRLTDGSGHAVFDAPRLPAEAGKAAATEIIAAALSLLPSEIGFENHRPSVFDSGVRFSFVPVRDLEVIGRARPAPARWEEAFGGGPTGAFVYTRGTVGVGRQFHARMFALGMGIAEDPATGAAAAGFAGAVHRFDAFPAGRHRLLIEQGFEMGRPSIIALEIETGPDRLDLVRIGGDAVVVARGTLAIG